MVHEPYLAFWEGSWRQTAAAAVHRVMTAILVRAARRIWMSIPAWEPLWKPYALGRALPFAWLPIPSGLTRPDCHLVAERRKELGSGPLVGHLGTYGSPVASALRAVLADMLDRLGTVHVVLIGSGSEQFRKAFAEHRPEHSSRVTATGVVSHVALASYVAACDVLVQPYPDGVSSRRTTAMAGLHLA
jgi:hypothetical protein